MTEGKTEGVVLRHANYRERDRMVTLLSPTLGRVDAIAYGSRKPGGRLSAGTEWFACGEYQVETRGARMRIAQCQLLEGHYDLRARYDRLTHAAYLCGLLEEAAQPQEPAEALYVLLRGALLQLTYGDVRADDVTAMALVRLCAALGYVPIVHVCASCGGALHPDGARWDAERGGVMCRDCARAGLPPLFTPAIDVLRRALELPATQYVQGDPVAAREARRAMQTFLLDRLERKPKALPLLEGLDS